MTQSESTSGVVHRRGASALADLVAEMEAYYAQRAPIYDASMGYDDPERVARLEPVVAALEDALLVQGFEAPAGAGPAAARGSLGI